MQREKEEREWKEAQERKTEATSKLIDFITNDLAVHVSFDYQKKMLGYHQTFSAQDMFREIDQNNNGELTSAEFCEYFKDDNDFEGFNFENVTRKWNMHGEDRLSFVDFREGLAPYSSGRDYYGSVSNSYPPRARTEEAREAQAKAARSQLKLVLYLVGKQSESTDGVMS